MFRAPPDDGSIVYEAFSPFAHIPGRFEWCRIISPTHGVFDTFIVLGASTTVPATVYVASDDGESFMADRYPECTTIRAQELTIDASRDGRVVQGRLLADAGPIREADFALTGEDVRPEQASYGGFGDPVWGSKWTCWGVDHNIPATAKGSITTTDGREDLDGTPGIVALASFARIAPLKV